MTTIDSKIAIVGAGGCHICRDIRRRLSAYQQQASSVFLPLSISRRMVTRTLLSTIISHTMSTPTIPVKDVMAQVLM